LYWFNSQCLIKTCIQSSQLPFFSKENYIWFFCVWFRDAEFFWKINSVGSQLMDKVTSLSLFSAIFFPFIYQTDTVIIKTLTHLHWSITNIFLTLQICPYTSIELFQYRHKSIYVVLVKQAWKMRDLNMGSLITGWRLRPLHQADLWPETVNLKVIHLNICPYCEQTN
jgi:hypothetical protein